MIMGGGVHWFSKLNCHKKTDKLGKDRIYWCSSPIVVEVSHSTSESHMILHSGPMPCSLVPTKKPPTLYQKTHRCVSNNPPVDTKKTTECTKKLPFFLYQKTHHLMLLKWTPKIPSETPSQRCVHMHPLKMPQAPS